MKLHLMLTAATLGLLLASCRQGPEVFAPELYAWEEARDSITLPCKVWKINCGSPDAAIYRYDAARLAPGVACEEGWLFDAFMLCEKPCEGEDLPDYWLNPVYGTVASLEKAISGSAATLGEPTVKRLFTIALPHGADDNECITYIDSVRAMAAALDCQHIELLGFTSSEVVSERVRRYAAACHEAILDEAATVSFDYSVVEDIMDQPGVRSMDGQYTLKDVPARQQALIDALSSQPSEARGEISIVMDCGSNTLVQLNRSTYASDKALLEKLYAFLLTK
ncbi:MAG: hypothetical protein J6W09_08595 [Bacteroidales bacterium]|nr:hypothetical protein [Bacteroidales bacterium]